jgi:hypothetical protein
MIATMERNTEETYNVTIAVTREAMAAVDRISDDTGVSKKRIMSLAFLWFAAQDDVLQKGILGLLPRGMEVDITRMALGQLARNAAADRPADAITRIDLAESAAPAPTRPVPPAGQGAKGRK